MKAPSRPESPWEAYQRAERRKAVREAIITWLLAALIVISIAIWLPQLATWLGTCG